LARLLFIDFWAAPEQRDDAEHENEEPRKPTLQIPR
jgi:hypothetical protein